MFKENPSKDHQIDFKALELLASKICHDLVSPIGALNNGLEIITEMGNSLDDDITALMDHSVKQASVRLQYFRLAYGLGGSDSNITLDDARKILEDFFAQDGKVNISWSLSQSAENLRSQRGFAKIFCCAAILAAESLPRGGTMQIEETGNIFVFRSQGTGAAFHESVLSALENKTETVNTEPRGVHAYLCALIAQNYQFYFETDNSENMTTLTLRN